MRLARTALFAAAAALPLVGQGCSAKVVGQLVLVIQTDMSLPKDIDTIRIEVTADGVPKFKNDYERVGEPDGPILLPGTLTILAPDKADAAIDIVVSARTGGKNGRVRFLNEAITTIPAERTAKLDMPIHFLCDGQAKTDNDGNVSTKCNQGETCHAGKCETNKVNPAHLPDYEESDVFGDGKCFDVAGCFDGAPSVEPDGNCTVQTGPDVSIALETQGDGICGKVGCYVALDAGSRLGWTVLPNGRTQLPIAVCEQLINGKILRVVAIPISANCKQKKRDLPTCGPWSTAGRAPSDDNGPVVLAGGQSHPSSLAVLDNTVYWVNSGDNNGANGELKSVPTVGAAPNVIASMTPVRDLVVLTGKVFYTSTLTGSMNKGEVFEFDHSDPNNPPTTKKLAMGLPSTEGIAVHGTDDLFWTDFGAGKIYHAAISKPTPTIVTDANYPYRVVADGQFVYWTNEGTAGTMPPDGSVVRYDYKNGGANAKTILADTQPTPREIVLDSDATTGKPVALYWATFVPDGSIMRVDLSGASPGSAVAIATKLAYPNGVALDKDNVYWTNRADGTVMSLPRSANPGDAPAVIASGQNAPGAIAVDDDGVYWVNGGASDQSNGALLKLPKKK